MNPVISVVFCLLAVGLSISALPSEQTKYGTFVSDCLTGEDACADEIANENGTATSIDGVTYCCADGNAITVTVSRTRPRYNQSITSTYLTSDELTGGAISNEVISGLEGEATQAPRPRRVACECRQLNDEEIDQLAQDVSDRVMSAFNATLDLLSGWFN